MLATYILTFLSLVEDRWAGMVEAFLLRVGIQLAAARVHAFLRHIEPVIYRQ